MRQVSAWLVMAAFVIMAACDGNDATSTHPTPTREPPPAPSIRIPPGKPITIGVSAALSGGQVNLGRDLADAVELAVADFGGTLKTHSIVVKRLDDGCTDPEQAVQVAKALLAEETLVAVIGPMCTTGALAANDEYEDAGIVHMSPSATRVDLSENGEAYFFRTAWRDDVQAGLQAAHAADALQARTALIIDDGDPYGRGLADAFSTAFSAHGGEVIARERIKRGDVDFVSLAREIAAAAPDLVVFEGLNPEGALMVKALREEQYAGAFMGPDGLLSARDFLGTALAAAEGAIITGGPVADEALVARFEQRFQRSPTTPFILQTHDAVTLLLRAIDRVAASDAGGLAIERAALLSQMRDTEFDGFTGRIAFDGAGDRRGETASEVGLRIYRVVEGRFQSID